jgi:5S rRNA maturation endonuclease (ribonuclease M5)
LTFKNVEKKNSKNENSVSDFLVLNSTSMLFKTEEILKKYDNISLFLDNDPAGNKIKEIIRKNYKNVEDCSLFYHNYKDLNEWGSIIVFQIKKEREQQFPPFSNSDSTAVQ